MAWGTRASGGRIIGVGAGLAAGLLATVLVVETSGGGAAVAEADAATQSAQQQATQEQLDRSKVVRLDAANLDTIEAQNPAALQKGAAGAAANRYLGASTTSSRSWHSGAWVGGWMNGSRATSWGAWRGTTSDVTPTFPEWDTWGDLANSTWHIDTFRGFKGRLVYGLPLLPRNAKPAQLQDVAAGEHDATFRKIARDLKARDRGDAVVRVGWEANGNWMPYSVTAANAKDYRDAYRRVVHVMREQAPELLFSFDINCGTVLDGQESRLDSLTKLYPGDDAADLVGCSVYDWDVIGGTNEHQWESALRPAKSVGLNDIAAFARAHGKGVAISEWGLAAEDVDGNGDNPFFIKAMHKYFSDNADVVVLESYFNEGSTKQGSSLWPEAPQNPKAGAEYKRLWGASSQ